MILQGRYISSSKFPTCVRDQSGSNLTAKSRKNRARRCLSCSIKGLSNDEENCKMFPMMTSRTNSSGTTFLGTLMNWRLSMRTKLTKNST